MNRMGAMDTDEYRAFLLGDSDDSSGDDDGFGAGFAVSCDAPRYVEEVRIPNTDDPVRFRHSGGRKPRVTTMSSVACSRCGGAQREYRDESKKAMRRYCPTCRRNRTIGVLQEPRKQHREESK